MRKRSFSSIAIGMLSVNLLLLFSCVENQTIGDELLSNNRVQVKTATNKESEVNTNFKNKATWNSISTAFLGTLNDKELGQTHNGVALQFRMSAPMNLYSPEIDSVRLILTYESTYGDSTILQKARVYKLEGDLDDTQAMEDDYDITPLLGEEVGMKVFREKDISDTIFWKSKLDNSKDSLVNGKKVKKTLINTLKIPLDKQKIGQFILNGSKNVFVSSEDFIQYFKGLYLKTDVLDASKEGALYGFNVYKTNLVLYYRNGRAEGDKRDTIASAFKVTDNSVRLNNVSFKKGVLNDDANYISLLGLGGSKAKLEIPNFQNWADSVNYAINKAELSFKVVRDETKNNGEKLPNCLALSFVDDEDKTYSLNSYNIGSASVINGKLNPQDSTYTFLVSGLLQNVVKGDIKIKYFELTSADMGMRVEVGNYGRETITPYTVGAKNTAKRVILYNKGEFKPSLNVIYTVD